jgi:CheY-like chemotaxis protein/HPt (histidine-containing phosphotransfer) domain-containing protein
MREHSPEMTRIVYVDDDSTISAMVERILRRREDFHVSLATDIESAIALIRAQPPDLVISDLRLGSGDAVVIIEHLRGDAATSAVPVLIVSGDQDPSTEARLLAAGASGFLAKPFEFGDLLAAVDRLLDATVVADDTELVSAPSAAGPAPAGPLERGAVEALRRLVDDSVEGPELLVTVVRNLQANVDRLDAALERSDVDGAMAAAHNLAGSAGVAGAMRLGLMGRDVQERIAASGIDPSVRAAIDTELAHVLAALRDEFPSLRDAR